MHQLIVNQLVNLMGGGYLTSLNSLVYISIPLALDAAVGVEGFFVVV